MIVIIYRWLRSEIGSIGHDTVDGWSQVFELHIDAWHFSCEQRDAFEHVTFRYLPEEIVLQWPSMTGLSIKDIVVVGFSGSVLVGTHDMKSIHKSIKSGPWTSAWIWLKYCSIPISYEHNQHLCYPKKIRESKLQFSCVYDSYN